VRFADGQVQLHPFALDVTGFRYDVSHRYDHPLVRVTTFVGEPARHDLFMNVGFFTELMHYDTMPRGIAGEQALTLGTLQGRSTCGSPRICARTSACAPARAPRCTSARGARRRARRLRAPDDARGQHHPRQPRHAAPDLQHPRRSPAVRQHPAEPVPNDWAARASGAYEAILLAINDQPVSFRLAFDAAVTDGPPPVPGSLGPLEGNLLRLGVEGDGGRAHVVLHAARGSPSRRPPAARDPVARVDGVACR
jgi:hypothetical protein